MIHSCLRIVLFISAFIKWGLINWMRHSSWPDTKYPQLLFLTWCEVNKYSFFDQTLQFSSVRYLVLTHSLEFGTFVVESTENDEVPLQGENEVRLYKLSNLQVGKWWAKYEEVSILRGEKVFVYPGVWPELTSNWTIQLQLCINMMLIHWTL